MQRARKKEKKIKITSQKEEATWNRYKRTQRQDQDQDIISIARRNIILLRLIGWIPWFNREIER